MHKLETLVTHYRRRFSAGILFKRSFSKYTFLKLIMFYRVEKLRLNKMASTITTLQMKHFNENTHNHRKLDLVALTY